MRERMVDTVDSLPHKMAASLPLLVADLRASVRELEAAVQEAVTSAPGHNVEDNISPIVAFLTVSLGSLLLVG